MVKQGVLGIQDRYSGRVLFAALHRTGRYGKARMNKEWSRRQYLVILAIQAKTMGAFNDCNSESIMRYPVAHTESQDAATLQPPSSGVPTLSPNPY